MQPLFRLIPFALACVPPGSTPDEPTPSGPTMETFVPTSDDPVALTVSMEALPTNPLAAQVMVTADRAVALQLAYGTDGTLNRRTPEVSLAANEPTEILVLGLYPEDWEIAPVVGGVEGTRWRFSTSWPEPLLEAETTDLMGGFSLDEAICMAREAERPAYACTDRQGRPTLYVPLPFNAMFVRPLSDGTFVAHPDGSEELLQFDRAGRPVRTVSLDTIGDTTHRHDWIDEHEVIELLEGPWAGHWAILTAIEAEDRIGAGIVVVDPETQDVVWDWSSHGPLGDGESVDEAKLPYDRFGVIEHGADWLHANAVVHGTDEMGDYFWMSLRHQDWIIEIRAPSGEISWRLGRGGDFTLEGRPEGDWFYHQHAPELRRNEDGTIAMLVFDNGNGRPGTENPRTRILELVVDRNARTADVSFDLVTEFFSFAAGDADRMPDDSSILFTRAVGQPFVAEVGRDQERRWLQRYEDEGEVYRAEFYPSLYETSWQAETGW